MAETVDLGRATDLSQAQPLTRNPWLAVDVATDPVAHAVSLQRAHELSLTDSCRPVGIRDVVAASWTRSLAAGVAPGAAGAPVVLAEGKLEAARAASPLAPLIDTILLSLASLEADAPHVIAIGDPNANLLWVAGDAATVEAAREMGFQDGAAWAETRAGTNAVGTAAALDHAVQIFSAEHLLAAVHPWTCSAAPIHDPATGDLIGIIDLTEPLRRAHPHTLSLAVLAARAAEASLRVRQLESAARRRERWVTTLGTRSRGVLLNARGRVIAARGLTEPPADFNRLPPPGATVQSSDGRSWEREDLADGDVILWLSGRTSASTPRLTVRLLGQRPQAQIADRKENGLRSLELLAVLATHPDGLTAEQLALALYGERGKTVTVRAQVHRLRRHLGEDLLDTQPYRLLRPVDGDWLEVQRLLSKGKPREALEAYRGPLLSASDAPAVREARALLDESVRRSVLTTGDADLLARWLAHPSGTDDLAAARALVAALPVGDPRRAAATAAAALLGRRMAPPHRTAALAR